MSHYDLTIYDCEHHTIGGIDFRSSHTYKGSNLDRFWCSLALQYYSVEEVVKQLESKLKTLYINSIEYKNIEPVLLSLKEYDMEGNYVYINWS
jgi:uncharacterized lipoprotein YehR (DUF1307 family)